MDFNYLDLSKTTFQTAPDGTLRVIVQDDRCGLYVEAMCAMPLSHPTEFIVLRDGKKSELGVLKSLSDAPPEVQKILTEQLHRRYFLPRVTAILNVSERFGSALWEMETDRGRVKATTRSSNEALFEVEPGRFLLTDVDGNRYEIPNLADLDETSQARFLGKM